MEDSLLTIRQLAANNAALGVWPSKQSTIERLIKNNEDGFADKCVRRIGKRRILISSQGFKEWAGAIASASAR